MPKARRPRVPERARRRAVSKPPQFEAAEFLTIDLDVRSRRSIAPLVAAWPSSYQPLPAEGRSTPRWLILNAGNSANAEAAAEALLSHIRSLRGAARLCWKRAEQRTFDVGVQAGGSGRAFEHVRLTAETLRCIGATGANIQVTVYPPEPQSPAVPRGRTRSPAGRRGE
jgi:hypothetical protein